MPANFIEVTSGEQLDALFRESHEHPVALVKHSDTCGISANVMYDLKEIDAQKEKIQEAWNQGLWDMAAKKNPAATDELRKYAISKGVAK